MDEIIPNHLHADEDKLDAWLDRMLNELRAYNGFPDTVSIVTKALARFADEAEHEGQYSIGQAVTLDEFRRELFARLHP